ncbi:ASCH domain-containing protein [Mycobacterium intracellulare]|uniref:ASCH domain-containing protein n=1 Tax=Mycobacterium intracellulare TaxID=1767 RepID=A0AAE4RFX1_MYCIT|nr:ASCH domain-containing protein [Mycobacterium intracellulare]MDV6979624.1 ASCH domain-containing protein [Mycobacterium intracellulare]MDV6985127.1 ASCH domain-containing protein [Mycobacterium intracellulare]MDV7014253.1 ASCH domain-containing protein [Mycobacterium intracellulare]MDV7030118.1 ASCH domain-containing protein [Mycobacterium intracellulare]
MKALTVRQPWAWAIINAGKNVENRTRNIAGRYRGSLLIHASRTEDITAWGHPAIRDATKDPHLPRGLVYGVIIGVVDLVDVHNAYYDNGLPIQHTECDRDCEPWGEPGPGVHHLVLRNPRPLPTPIPCRGALGLWTPPADIVEQLRAVTHG